MPTVKVKSGDSIASIAAKYGLSWETVWSDTQNKELREKRKDPNTLCKGDTVFIKDIESKQESANTETKKKFRRKGMPEKLNLCLQESGNPLSKADYILDIEGRIITGKLDENGGMEHSLKPQDKTAKLTVQLENKTIEYTLLLGALPPYKEVSGAKSRLNNLGYYCDDESDEVIDMMIVAMNAFQKDNSMSETKEIDDETLETIEKKYQGKE